MEDKLKLLRQKKAESLLGGGNRMVLIVLKPMGMADGDGQGV